MLCGILFSAYAWRADDKSQRSQFPSDQDSMSIFSSSLTHQSFATKSGIAQSASYPSTMVMVKKLSWCSTALLFRVRSFTNLNPVRHHSIWNIWFIDESCRFVTTFIGLNKSWLMFSEHGDKKECLVVKNWISFTF